MEHVFKGGARVGELNATWPFAELRISDGVVQLTIANLSDYILISSDIESIETLGASLLVAGGVKFNHGITSYAKDIIFWSSGSPQEIVDSLIVNGIVRNDQVLNYQSRSTGFVWRKIIPVLIVLVGFFVADIVRTVTADGNKPWPIFSVIGLSMLILTAFGLYFLHGIRRSLTRNDASDFKFRRLLISLILVSWFILLVLILKLKSA